MTPDYPPTTNTTMVINNINHSVRHTLVVSTPWVHPRENCAKLVYVQNVRLFSILWFCILLTSFLLFILLTACGECSCCCKLLKSCRNVTLHKPKLLKRENLVQGHRLCWQSYYTKENNLWMIKYWWIPTYPQCDLNWIFTLHHQHPESPTIHAVGIELGILDNIPM